MKGRRKTNTLVISAKTTSGDAKVEAERAPDGTIQVEVKGHGTVNFDIEVPESTNLKLLSFRGSMHISHSSGAIKASILNDGSIELTDLQSPSVEAHSANGNVIFKGAVLPTGRYALKSLFRKRRSDSTGRLGLQTCRKVSAGWNGSGQVPAELR